MILLVKGDTVDDNRFWDQTDKSWVVWLLAIIYGLLTPRMMRIFKPVNFHSDKMVGDIFFGRTPADNCTNSWYKYFWISYVLYIFFTMSSASRCSGCRGSLIEHTWKYVFKRFWFWIMLANFVTLSWSDFPAAYYRNLFLPNYVWVFVWCTINHSNQFYCFTLWIKRM